LGKKTLHIEKREDRSRMGEIRKDEGQTGFGFSQEQRTLDSKSREGEEVSIYDGERR
jgi:hypothetical protein